MGDTLDLKIQIGSKREKKIMKAFIHLKKVGVAILYQAK